MSAAAQQQALAPGAKVVIVGSGVAGLVTAWLLKDRFDVHVLEADARPGGHVHTHAIEAEGRSFNIDTGFIVFNEKTYPSFCKLLSTLGVASHDSDMGFSVHCDATGFEYAGKNLNTLFAQRSNAFRPSFYRMLRDILRFNKEAPLLLDTTEDEIPLGEYLQKHRYSQRFIHQYLLPMGAAIWSAKPSAMLGFPTRYFVRFFDNHGMLSVDDRPQWRVVTGGSKTYADALIAELPHGVRTSSGVAAVRRNDPARGVELQLADGSSERCDAVVFATHSDTALRILGDAATPLERELLGAIPYQANDAVLHTDTRLLPRRRRAWSAWNYHLVDGQSFSASDARVAVTYDMNILQGLDAQTEFLVTLNHTDAIDPSKILRRLNYHHPVFTEAGVAAQPRVHEISNLERRTLFCGAYWRYGFHEDGVQSAIAAARALGVEPSIAADPPATSRLGDAGSRRATSTPEASAEAS